MISKPTGGILGIYNCPMAVVPPPPRHREDLKVLTVAWWWRNDGHPTIIDAKDATSRFRNQAKSERKREKEILTGN